MSETNKSYRIKANVGNDKELHINLEQDYDILEILSLKIRQKNEYRSHSNSYGVIVGRVLANNGFGVPNAKIGIFIPRNTKDNDDIVKSVLYPYASTSTKNDKGVRFNLLPSKKIDKCHQAVGSFPDKRMVLDDNTFIEIFDDYYKFTTTTNNAGDYMIFGVPVGSYTLHMDLDISDCGVLSQRPRDFVYKGYTIEQFENPNQFKTSTELGSLSQIFTQDTTVNVIPFWGDESQYEDIGITRADIDVQFKFETTCVFMGSIVSDSDSEGISVKCVPTNRMGEMAKLTTGTGTIEMIRKKIDNTVEELQIKGKQLINGNGVWCYQIPMNLDYVVTDEYGNTVPSDNPEKGIPTRTDVRFRISMTEPNSEMPMYFRGKVLVPNNPKNLNELDYNFGSNTEDTSYKSLFMNNVYSVKSFIPRIQKSRRNKTERFTGIKHINKSGSNNPMPYNNLRIKLPFNFWITCNIVKLVLNIIKAINVLKIMLTKLIGKMGYDAPYTYISNELCPDLENWFFIPGGSKESGSKKRRWYNRIAGLTFLKIYKDVYEGETTDPTGTPAYRVPKRNDDGSVVIKNGSIEYYTDEELEELEESDNITFSPTSSEIMESTTGNKDSKSIDYSNDSNIGNTDVKISLTHNIDYLMQCVEINLAQEYELIKFDFYNDWVNGVIYLPRWARQVKYKRKRKNGKKVITEKVKGCLNDVSVSSVSRRYFQQCSLGYDPVNPNVVGSNVGCNDSLPSLFGGKGNCWRMEGVSWVKILGEKAGLVNESKSMANENIYYMKPCEWNNGNKINFFATDIILLGSLMDCNEDGIPIYIDGLKSTTYQMPTNLALTNADEEGYIYSSDKYIKLDDIKAVAGNDNAWKNNFNGKGWSQYISSGVNASQPTYAAIDEIMENIDKLGYAYPDTKKIMDYEDYMLVTEASGIDWGYTGPQQPLPSKDKFFSPGGHFLGLTCSNAETNIKSCINLQRACEAGVTLSQRIDIPVGFENKPDNEAYDKVNYLYLTPTGLISKDQVNDVNFRSIFATLNHNSLSTNFIDRKTGYQKYNFRYLYPNSFGGELSDKVNSGDYPSYNTKLDVNTEIDYIEGDGFKLPNGENIEFETGHTITRTIENKGNDYFNFRMGDNPTFLMTKNGLKYLPVFENSFYFYFGLKNGSTAIDEFIKQFYGSCGKDEAIVNSPSVKLSQTPGIIYDKQDIMGGYKMTKKINTKVYNMFTPVTINIYDGVYYSIEETEGAKSVIKNFSDNEFSFNCEFGIKTFVFTDANGTSIFKILNVGENEFNVGSINSVEYNTNVDGIIDFTTTDLNEYGGYIIGLNPQPVDSDNNSIGTYGNPYYYNISKNNGEKTISSYLNGWRDYYDADSKILRLFGVGEYTISVGMLLNNVEPNVTEGEYVVWKGYVGVSDNVPDIKPGEDGDVVVCNSSYKLSSKVFKKLQEYSLKNGVKWWEMFKNGTTPIDGLSDSDRYSLYRIVVNDTSRLSDTLSNSEFNSNEFFFNRMNNSLVTFEYGLVDSLDAIIAGQPEKHTNKEIELFKTDIPVLDKIEGYSVATENISNKGGYLLSMPVSYDMGLMKNGRCDNIRKPLYYSADKKGFTITQSIRGDLGIYENAIEFTSYNNDIIFLKDSIVTIKYRNIEFCGTIISIKNSSNNCVYNIISSDAGDTVDGLYKNATMIDMIEVPTIVVPFDYKFDMILDGKNSFIKGLISGGYDMDTDKLIKFDIKVYDGNDKEIFKKADIFVEQNILSNFNNTYSKVREAYIEGFIEDGCNIDKIMENRCAILCGLSNYDYNRKNYLIYKKDSITELEYGLQKDFIIKRDDASQKLTIKPSNSLGFNDEIEYYVINDATDNNTFVYPYVVNENNEYKLIKECFNGALIKEIKGKRLTSSGVEVPYVKNTDFYWILAVIKDTYPILVNQKQGRMKIYKPYKLKIA